MTVVVLRPEEVEELQLPVLSHHFVTKHASTQVELSQQCQKRKYSVMDLE
jgi:hypothetical protein